MDTTGKPIFDEGNEFFAAPVRLSSDTMPPTHQGALARVKAAISGRISSALLPCVRWFANDYLGGESVNDALAVAQRLASQGAVSTLGFWDTADYCAQNVVDIYLASLAHLSAAGLDASLSLKAPALRFEVASARQIAEAALENGVRLHFDSHGSEVVEATHKMLEAMRDLMGAANLGTTLPARWSRSADDAEWAIERALNIRIVKGQWPDPADPQRDMRAGFIELASRLAGRAAHVGVATHDLALATEAIALLKAAGTSCELEQILGMTTPRAFALARAEAIGIRVYIPFGRGYIPNVVGALRRDPRLAGMAVKAFFQRRQR